MIVLENFADGKLLEPFSGHYLDCINPATGAIYAKVPESTSEDLEIAIRAAKQAFPGWSITSRAHRSKLLNRLADLIRDNADELAQAESIDTGKPLQLASTIDIPRAAANFRFYASAIINESTEAHLMEGEAVNYTRRAPLGIVGCISPWNLPLYLLTWKIAPALATGNCVIAKPSEITPYTAYILSKLTIEAGFPSGVLNILHGSGKGIGSLIVEHPEIKAISFTGGTATGRQINQALSLIHI